MSVAASGLVGAVDDPPDCELPRAVVLESVDWAAVSCPLDYIAAQNRPGSLLLRALAAPLGTRGQLEAVASLHAAVDGPASDGPDEQLADEVLTGVGRALSVSTRLLKALAEFLIHVPFQRRAYWRRPDISQLQAGATASSLWPHVRRRSRGLN